MHAFQLFHSIFLCSYLDENKSSFKFFVRLVNELKTGLE